MTKMTLAIFKNCSEMMKATAPALQPQPVIAPSSTKPVQATDISTKLGEYTLAGIDDMYWPNEKVMIKMESAPGGKFLHINLHDWLRPTWSTADVNKPPAVEGKFTMPKHNVQRSAYIIHRYSRAGPLERPR